jgi:hypothetical protein
MNCRRRWLRLARRSSAFRRSSLNCARHAAEPRLPPKRLAEVHLPSARLKAHQWQRQKRPPASLSWTKKSRPLRLMSRT